jgi:hypothetical protein
MAAAGEWTVDALWGRIGSLIDKFAPVEGMNSFGHCGYPACKP